MNTIAEEIKRRGLDQAFFARLRKVKASACWLWRGHCNSDGYGQYKVRGMGTLLAHRVAFELATGKSADGLVVRHSCDTPRCCRPEHLLLGTHAENVADRVARGRSSRLGNPKKRALVKNSPTRHERSKMSITELLDAAWRKRLKNQSLR